MSKDLNSFSGSISNSNLGSVSASISSSENNGGKTDYYALPIFTVIELEGLLELVATGDISPRSMAETLVESFPSTLNDLIEHKEMQPWQHEVFKATYALRERALKNPKKGSSKIREINKIIYYAKRGLDLAVKESNK